jgi:predicted nucleic acid-binding Zn ribbon protein
MKIELARGRPREARPLMYVVAALFVLTFVWPAIQGLLV